MKAPYATWANGITAARFGLFFIFLYALYTHMPYTALVLFAVIWALDGIDGFVARLLHEDTPFGSQFDKVIDRIIIVVSVAALIRMGYIDSSGVFILVKDLGSVPALTMQWSKHKAVPGGGMAGKIMTAMQGATVILLFMQAPLAPLAAYATGVVGGAVSVRYLTRLQAKHL